MGNDGPRSLPEGSREHGRSAPAHKDSGPAPGTTAQSQLNNRGQPRAAQPQLNIVTVKHSHN
ncbi:hypothetical protein GCM10010510_36440 [Streptomyces anandii JCM 4720]|nr:hypothetical protein GCM10010510_36440 [Streptomyces anandii JCM 4720]